MTTFYTVNDIERKHKGHWFSKDSMRFFKSRVCEEVYESNDGLLVYFVSSEQHDKYPRLYSVRVYNVQNDSIKTVGEFQGYSTALRAKNQAKRLAKALNHG